MLFYAKSKGLANQKSSSKNLIFNNSSTALQNGRTMVEMLGVLAIVGILSIGGIAGYTLAMNKYRANVILNEAQKRAMDVATRIASGNKGEWDDESRAYFFPLDEFTDNSFFGAEFAEDALWYLDSQIEIDVYDVPSAVCEQMKLIAQKKNQFKILGSCNSDQLTVAFNNDMSDTENVVCRDNSHCDQDEFCKVTGSYAAWGVSGGECAPKGSYIPRYVEGLGYVGASDEPMGLWAAHNWCRSHGKKLIPVDDFKCYVHDSETLITTQTGPANTACLKANTPPTTHYLCADVEANPDSFSPIMVNLLHTEGLGCHLYWTASASFASKNYYQIYTYCMQ